MSSGGSTKVIVSLSVFDSPPALRVLKYTVFRPFPPDSSKPGPAEYGSHDAPAKLGSSLAMYSVGAFVHVLFSVTPRDEVLSSPPSIANTVNTGGSTNVMESLKTFDSPVSFINFKYTVFGPLPADSVNRGAVS